MRSSPVRGVNGTVEDLDAVAEHAVDPEWTANCVIPSVRKVRHPFARRNADGVRVEEEEVRPRSGRGPGSREGLRARADHVSLRVVS